MNKSNFIASGQKSKPFDSFDYRHLYFEEMAKLKVAENQLAKYKEKEDYLLKDKFEKVEKSVRKGIAIEERLKFCKYLLKTTLIILFWPVIDFTFYDRSVSNLFLKTCMWISFAYLIEVIPAYLKSKKDFKDSDYYHRNTYF